MLLQLEQLLLLRMPLLVRRRRTQHQGRSSRRSSSAVRGPGGRRPQQGRSPFLFRHGPLGLDLAPVDGVRLGDDARGDLRVGEDDEAKASRPASGALVGDEGLV